MERLPRVMHPRARVHLAPDELFVSLVQIHAFQTPGNLFANYRQIS